MVTGTNAGTVIYPAVDALELRANELHAGAFWRLWGSFGDGGCFKSITAGTTATARTGANTRTGTITGTAARTGTSTGTGADWSLLSGTEAGTGKTLSGWTQ